MSDTTKMVSRMKWVKQIETNYGQMYQVIRKIRNAESQENLRLLTLKEDDSLDSFKLITMICS